MNRRGIWLPALLLAFLMGGSASADSGPTVDWWVIANGGGPTTGGNVTVNDTLGQPIIGTAGGSAALSAGYWVTCRAAAAVAPAVSVAVSGADVVLTWGGNAANAKYQVWISENPYFDPANPGSVTPVIQTATTFTDGGAAGSLTNHFYVVRGVNGCGAASGNSNRMGEFTFGLTK